MANWGDILAGAANGYLRGTQIVAARDQQEKDSAYLEEKRNRERKDWAAKDSLQNDLKLAAAPVAVTEGSNGAVLPPAMDARDIGQPGEAPLQQSGQYRVGGQVYADQAAATAAAGQQNDPMNVAARQAAVYNQRGMPAEAAVLENKQAALAKQAADFKEKGLMTAMGRFRAGDKAGAVKGIKDSGMFKMADDNVTMTPRKLDVPGVGEIQTYDMTFNAKNPDGTVEPVTINSHAASMALMPYEKALELQGKGLERADKADDRAERRATSAVLASSLVALRESQAARADRSGGSGGGANSASKADRETRLTLQNLTGNVGREIREIDAALKDEVMVPGAPLSARAKELVQQRAELTQRRSELNEELSSLPRTTAGAGSSGSSAAARNTPAKPVETKYGNATKVTTKAEYDRLPSGALYIPPTGGEPLRKK